MGNRSPTSPNDVVYLAHIIIKKAVVLQMSMGVSFIGFGNMAQAIAKGLLSGGICEPGDVFVYDIASGPAKIAASLGFSICASGLEAAGNAPFVFLCVKPAQALEVCREISGEMDSKVLVSIAAGVQVGQIEAALGQRGSVVRVMPNLPATVGAAASAVCVPKLGDESLWPYSQVNLVFASLGKVFTIVEGQMDAFVSLAGSSPAMVFMLVNSMADAGVALGIPRREAIEMSAAAVFGSAKLVLESGEHPMLLKDMVCSPAGTTIEMVRSLESDRFPSAIIEALVACHDKCKLL
ncbi:MAG: pyrroline-5-carboxylate reductase [Eubacteriaceae bacterium]|nr:pyrroline-5-carboxylate reductase [Eubacteriaceae bacterium]